ncbi:glycosyltransferase, partial [Helicobacter burdigaliensis]
MQSVLIFHFHSHITQPRVRREYDFLLQNYKVSGLGYVDCNREGVKFYQINKPKWTFKMKFIQRIWLLLRRYEKVYWDLPQVKDAEEILKQNSFDIIIAHNEETLPLVLKYRKNSKIIANMHEYSPREFENYFWWKFYFAPYKHYLCKTYLPKVDYMYTVCEGIAEEY